MVRPDVPAPALPDEQPRDSVLARRHGLDLANPYAAVALAALRPGGAATGAVRLDSVEDALTALRRGEPVVVVDDENRENEGDLVLAAEHATTERLAFMLEHTSGVLCVGLPAERCDALDLPPMVQRNTDPKQTAFTVSVDARLGTTTGISAADRATTIRTLVDPAARPDDLLRPGHVFPLRARDGGVLERAGHTEAAVDLARLAGLAPAGVLCEVVTADRTGMARVPELRALADRHGLAMISIADLIAHRRPTDPAVRRVSTAPVPTVWGDFTAVAHQGDDGTEHLTLVYGEPLTTLRPLVRIHSECLTGDVFGSLRCDCGPQLHQSMRRVVEAGAGAVVYLRGHEGRGIGIGAKLAAYRLQDAGRDTVDANLDLGLPVDGREFHTAAAILDDLGLHAVDLLTNNPAKHCALRDAGIEATMRRLETTPTSRNVRYLTTKRQRLGHLLTAPGLRVVGSAGEERRSPAS